MSAAPLILEVKGNSLDDGPGIRTVVFFKGCPLDCAWCHNPESRSVRTELSFEASDCSRTGRCVTRCPERALDPARPGLIDRDRCTLCYECLPACPGGALSQVGRPMTVAELVKLALRDAPFHRASGGGVTLSGGEPAMFSAFAGELAQALRAEQVHVLLETCGQFELARFDRELYPHLDAIYFDLKLADEQQHLDWCGASNRRILANFAELQRRALFCGVPLLPRIPLVPKITARAENLAALAAFLASCGTREVALLPYNPLWRTKLGKLGKPARFTGSHAFMRPEEVVKLKAPFVAAGLACGPQS